MLHFTDDGHNLGLGRHQQAIAISQVDIVHQFVRLGNRLVDATLAGIEGLSLRPFIDAQRPRYVVLTGLEMPRLKRAIQSDYVFHSALPEDEWVPPRAGFPSYARWIVERMPERAALLASLLTRPPEGEP